ncbi:nik-1 protein os-1p protein [Fusarium sporotrichioides]|uniref:histidine kinase n=1 Tax=Fusarium sporotrichioides TaxID=5514 RepID=A0A395RN78_FUSSP|nr:nik-1 protein os-1p protein [Fusarium sporotrichioides]
MATLTECVEVPKKTVVSEATRERETFRYDDSLFTNVRYNNSGSPIPQSELVTCPDVIFTALARLAASQTGAAKAMISLFDQTHQYIIAEASATTPLVPSLGYDSHHETLWHCGTAIPRAHSACESTLCSDDPPESGPDGFRATRQLPVIVVDDVTTDPEYSAKPYCRPGGAARFYAAVPIRTDRGVNIGVICVIDTEPALPWNYQLSRLMRELSKAVTEHLETISLKSNQRRSEKKAAGLSVFVEGDAQPVPSGTSLRENEQRPNGVSKTQRPEIEHIQNALGDMNIESSTVTITNTHEVTSGQGENTRVVQPPPDGFSVHHDPNRGLGTPREAFSKAARIIKESIEIDGCMFLNADMLEFSTTGVSSDWMEEDVPTRRRSTFSHHDSEDAYTTGSSDDRSRPSCQVLGSSEEDTLNGQRACISLPQSLLARMIRRYPKGHIFNLDANGQLQPDELSDESNHRALNNGQDKNNSSVDATNKQENGLRIQRREANILREAFPGSRSVAFVPIWDPRKKRWSAGGFVYSFNIKRSFTIDLDLSYLGALGMLAAAEAFRLETLAADRAKTDALGSLSHELRSPLHGAVLSVELLNDTDLSIPQQNIVRTIETCCRTLSDTIDHLLEYSKVNKPLPQEGARENHPDRHGVSRAPTIGGTPNSSTKVVQLDVLAEEVLESVYAGFNFQHVSLAQAAQSTSQPPRRPGHTSIRRMDTMQAIEELRTPAKNRGSVETKIGDVEIFLVIDSRPSWGFYTQPGPVRRIVMNLFGNSLKYTTKGLIRVSLEQTSALGADDNDCWVTITVSDTGVGISDDFLQNGLFKPFSQENHLSPGTGLGLSFVKQIAAQFGGQISVKSRVGAGTTVTVRLPMKRGDDRHKGVSEVRQREEEFEAQADKLRGLRVKVIDFGNNESDSSGTKMESPCQFVQNMCNEWLGMQVNTGFETPCLMPDLAIWSEQGFEKPYDQKDTMPDVPNIVVCANALTVHQYACGTKTIPRPGIFEFISQPLGPRKLAKACSLALYRWTVAQTSTDSPTTASRDQDSLTVPDNIASSIPHPTSPFPLSAEATPTQTTQGYFRSPEFLLVDDNFINLKILSSYMKKLKQPYQTASDGLEAVTAYEADPGRYTCILMDISMPVMDGFEATRRIRAFEAQQGLRPALILALTGLASEEAQREAEVSGLDLFLTKPVRLKELGPILRAKGVLEEESNLG